MRWLCVLRQVGVKRRGESSGAVRSILSDPSALTNPSPNGSFISLVFRPRQYLTKHCIDFPAGVSGVLPLSRVAQRYLFKTNAVDMIRAPDVEMSLI